MVSVLGVALLGPPQYTATIPSGDSASDEALAQHVQQLDTCREGLLDPQARPEDRHRWAELLFSYDSPEAASLVVELLSDAQHPDVQRALCEVLADQARRNPNAHDPGLIPPLLDLLGTDDAELRGLAAEALAAFPGEDVPARLGALAAQKDVPLTKRMAAIDAMAPNTHRREVLKQLVQLLSQQSPDITDRVVAALESATPQTFGRDLDRWRQWWEKKSALTEEQWLREQVEVHRERARRLAQELATHRREAEARLETITARARRLQRDLFRALSSDQQEEKLAVWLVDPLPVIKLTALAIIKSRIADEGKRPEGQVLSTLLQALQRDEDPLVRRDVLEIVQTLNDPVVVEAVLGQLDREHDPVTRHAIFQAIGKLDGPEAIPSLIREIGSADGAPDCVREAAIALGKVAEKAKGSEALKDAPKALKARYADVQPDDHAMRAALLSAMAGIADSAFTPEFLGAVESDDGTVLQPAIRGLMAIGNAEKLPRFRTLMTHSDPLVRLAATEAVGQIGGEDADLEGLLTRLDQTIETNELARDAAWRGFQRIISRRSLTDRVKAAERLRHLPKLEVRYLKTLLNALSDEEGHGADRESVLDRLATILLSERRYPEAVPHLRALYDLRAARSDPSTMETGLRLLDAVLRDPASTGIGDFIRKLADGSPGETTEKAVERVKAYLESEHAQANVPRTRRLLTELRALPPELMGPAWTGLLDDAAKRFHASGEEGPPSPG